MGSRKRKSWAEKLADARIKAAEPKRIRCEESGQWFVVPGVPEIEEMMRGVRRGRVMTLGEMMAVLKERHAVDFCCPMTTGIFSWIVAHAADDEERAGKKRVTPWWRILKTDRSLNPKWPGGGETQRARLLAEGHLVVEKGRKLLVPAR